MADRQWIMFAVSGIGQHCAWVATTDLELAEGPVPCENLTRIAIDPSGRIGMAKVCDEATLNFSTLPYWLVCPTDLKADLAKIWNTGEIISLSEKKILKHD